MYSDQDLDSAVKAGVFTRPDVEAFYQLVGEKNHTLTSHVDEEHFRLISGFNDIFVVIACLLLLFAVSWIGEMIAPVLGLVLLPIISWGLAEFFTLKRRMALPSIILSLCFIGGCQAPLFFLLKGNNVDYEPITIVLCFIGVAAATAHWFRFKVPITITAGAGCLFGGMIVFLFSTFPEITKFKNSIIFISGTLIFLFAMFWDFRDTARTTHRSDVAFWLHLLAAPIIIHPIFSFLQIFSPNTGLTQAVIVTLLYIFIALVSLTIDRRALMVSSLTYVLYTFSSLLKSYGFLDMNFAITSLIIGALLLLLSAFWQPCRRVIIYLFPATLQKRLPQVG